MKQQKNRTQKNDIEQPNKKDSFEQLPPQEAQPRQTLNPQGPSKTKERQPIERTERP